MKFKIQSTKWEVHETETDIYMLFDMGLGGACTGDQGGEGDGAGEDH